MGSQCQAHQKFDGASVEYKRALWAVVLINAVMFLIEMGAGIAAHSQALQADALDFFSDTVSYSLSLMVLGKTVEARNRVAFAKAASLLLLGLWVFFSTVYQWFFGTLPEPVVMGKVAVLALLANLLSVFLLVKFKDGDANVRSVWLCSRNDAIGNIAVIVAAVFVSVLGRAWPDLVVAMVMSGLFLSTAVAIFRQLCEERALR